MKARGFYWLTSSAVLLGYLWLGLEYYSRKKTAGGYSLCLVKNITGYPCPSCGSTRSVFELIQGNWQEAAVLNPLGYIMLIVLILIPFWLLYDLSFKKPTLFAEYQRAENTIKQRWIAFPLIALVLANWVWNVIKGF
jgi:hypothetical protein